jgi:hypothetical protein
LDLPVVEGRSLHQTVDRYCSGFPNFERHLNAFKLALTLEPELGVRLSSRIPRFAYELKTGTLNWHVLIDYFIHDDRIELMQVIPINPE